MQHLQHVIFTKKSLNPTPKLGSTGKTFIDRCSWSTMDVCMKSCNVLSCLRFWIRNRSTTTKNVPNFCQNCFFKTTVQCAILPKVRWQLDIFILSICTGKSRDKNLLWLHLISVWANRFFFLLRAFFRGELKISAESYHHENIPKGQWNTKRKFIRYVFGNVFCLWCVLTIFNTESYFFKNQHIATSKKRKKYSIHPTRFLYEKVLQLWRSSLMSVVNPFPWFRSFGFSFLD